MALNVENVGELSRLAKEIRNHHDECVAAGTVMQSAHERFQAEALLCGTALHRVKEIVSHGEFEGWVEKHCHFTTRTARNYMAMAKRKGVSDLKAPRLFRLTLPVLDRWAQWLRKRVPDPQAVLTWPTEEREKAAVALEPAARLYSALTGQATPQEGISFTSVGVAGLGT